MSTEDPGDDGPREDAPLARHLRDRPDRPIGEREFIQGRSRARLILLLFFVGLPVIVLVVVVLNSLASGPPDRDARASTGLNEVTRYCTYKARGDEQYRDCLVRTDFRVVRREDSNPARYARGELTRCLVDAGPRCTLR
ncbi:unannotated protein [freshwater metagenome]|uniref:Unannotated protein n=1 Tax=freshwater metagenome TaxID=449393 RepID=A0A6J7IHZ7_9ZZZZ|nr:hypothetical protein [Actinomycetota bacterium]